MTPYKSGRLFLQLIKKSLTSLDKFPLLNYHKTSNPHPLLSHPLKFQKKFSPTNMSPLKSKVVGREETMKKCHLKDVCWFVKDLGVGDIC